MIFSPQPHNVKDKIGMQIKIKGSVVDEVTNFNYLGLHIQNNLGWKSHMVTIISKLRNCCGIIYRIRSSTNASCMLALNSKIPCTCGKLYDLLYYHLARWKCCIA